MNQDLYAEFADQLGVDPEILEDRWDGRPDRLAEDIFRVRNLDTGQIEDLKLFQVQRNAIHAYFYGDGDTLSMYKGRRIGYSFIVCVAFLVEGMVKPESFYPIVSRKKEQAENRISDIKGLIENAKVEIPLAKKSTKSEIRLWNGSGFKAYTGDPEGSRGDESARAVLLDEMAFIEDQKQVSRAFGAFLALGKDRKMVQVSTPNVENDLFMQTHRRGTPTGYDEDGNYIGVISIKQPSFWNADEIDVHTPLHQQEVRPVRPDMNISRIEEERAADPEGFGQEYLCRPVVDEYRFFSKEAVELAMQKSEQSGYLTGAHIPNGADFRVIGVDIGISHDDTVISVFDHVEDRRFQRYLEVVDRDSLLKMGFDAPDPANANQVGTLIAWLYNQMDADLVVLDRTGPGETFDRILTEKIGRSVLGFNFSDKKSVEKMMGDMNNALRNGRVALLRDHRLKDELCSIVKEKKEDWSVPKFSGKDNSETGKDDTAMASVLAAFPPGYSVQPGREASQRGPPVEPHSEMTAPAGGVVTEPAQRTNFGSTRVARRGGGYRQRTTYNSRHSRR